MVWVIVLVFDLVWFECKSGEIFKVKSMVSNCAAGCCPPTRFYSVTSLLIIERVPCATTACRISHLLLEQLFLFLCVTFCYRQCKATVDKFTNVRRDN